MAVPATRWSAEFRLLLALLQGDLREAARLADTADEAVFARLLGHHRIALSLPPAADLASCLGEALTRRLAGRQRSMSLAALARTGLLLGAVRRLQAAGIPVCALKGPAFAAHFGRALRREGKDADILVPVAYRDQAIAELLAADFQPVGMGGKTADEHFARNHELNLLHRPSGQQLELHLRLGLDDRQFPMARFAPWTRLTTVRLGDAQVPTLSPVAAVLYAAFHGSKHNWFRLFWLVDIAWAMADPSFDWADVLQLARHMRAERQLMLGAVLAERLLAAPMPAVLSREHALLQRGQALAQTLLPHLEALSPDMDALVARLGLWRYLRWLLALYPAWGARFSLLGFMLLQVGDKDRQWMRLPRGLAWLYPLVRVMRLLGRYRAGREMRPRRLDTPDPDPLRKPLAEE